MKSFIEFLKEANVSSMTYTVPTIGTEPQTDEEGQEMEVKTWDKITKEFKKNIKEPNYNSIKKIIQGNKKLSSGAIELDMTPKPKASAMPVPMAEPQEGK